MALLVLHRVKEKNPLSLSDLASQAGPDKWGLCTSSEKGGKKHPVFQHLQRERGPINRSSGYKIFYFLNLIYAKFITS